jgi:hypothetical protein
MNDELEKQLRRALRPVDPGEDFADRVMARVQKEPVAPPRADPRRFRNVVFALAASLMIAAVGVHTWQLQRERRGLEARAQLLEALRMTGEKLDVAYRGVNGESPSPPDAGA